MSNFVDTLTQYARGESEEQRTDWTNIYNEHIKPELICGSKMGFERAYVNAQERIPQVLRELCQNDGIQIIHRPSPHRYGYVYWVWEFSGWQGGEGHYGFSLPTGTTRSLINN